GWGLPFGRQPRPLFLKLLTNSFSFRHLKISLAGSAHLRSANHAATLRQRFRSCDSPSKVFSSLPRNLTHLIMGEASSYGGDPLLPHRAFYHPYAKSTPK